MNFSTLPETAFNKYDYFCRNFLDKHLEKMSKKGLVMVSKMP